jgi:hypothetical protein
MADIMSQTKQVFEIAYQTIKTAVESGEDFKDVLPQLAQYIMPFAKSIDDLEPIYKCTTVEEIKDVLNTQFNVNPVNLATTVYTPDVIDHLLDGKSDFNVITAKELDTKIDELFAPINSVMTGKLVKGKFSKCSVSDLQPDIKTLIGVSKNCEDGVKVHIVAYEM